MKTKVINFFKDLFPSREDDGVLSQYQNITLDNTPEPVYTGGMMPKEGFVGMAGDGVQPVEFKSVKLGTMVMEEVKKPVVTVETIVNAVENKYPKAVVELAKILRDMKVQYSLHASAFSSKLFEAQDTLGLTSGDVTAIMDQIISQKDVIIDTTQVSIDIINKPKL